MIIVSTKNLKVGDELAEPLYLPNGYSWMPAGTIVNNQELINKIKEKGIEFVKVKSNQLDSALNSYNMNNSNRENEKNIERIKDNLSNIKKNYINLDEIINNSSDFEENFLKNNNLIYKVNEKNGKILDIYDRAIAIAQYSLTLARIVGDYRNKNNINTKNLSQLKDFYSTVVISALMSKMGSLCKDDKKMMSVAMSGINQKVIERISENRMKKALKDDKTRKVMIYNGINVEDLDGLYKKFYMLTQNKFLNYDEKYMPLYSYGLIKSSEESLKKAFPNLSIAEAAILHQKDNRNHMNAFIDIPYKDKKGNDTDTTVISKIIKIASDYDELGREYLKKGKQFDPKEIISYMENLPEEYDTNFLKIFKDGIPQYDIGDIVIMDNGLEGIVVEPKYNMPNRPLVAVKIPTSQYGETEIIDLAKTNGIIILGKKINYNKER